MLLDGLFDKEAPSKPFVNIIYLNLARTGSRTPQPSKESVVQFSKQRKFDESYLKYLIFLFKFHFIARKKVLRIFFKKKKKTKWN